ncbi:MAG: CYTH domain-containing protein [Verrucomicrobia bacterium]|nr:CYTH domain-containing protein [Verrucomicrobiota bacterium]
MRGENVTLNSFQVFPSLGTIRFSDIMGIEIERKFLVKNPSWRDLVETSRPCTQGYVNLTGNGSIRIRMIGDKGFLTLKGPREGIRRSEFSSIP